MRKFIILGTALALAGCSQMHLPWQKGPDAQPALGGSGPISPGEAVLPSSLDRTTAAERQAALTSNPAQARRKLGVTVASLGSPARPGFWLRTPLVQTEEKGRIEVAGKRLAVDLLPGNGPKGGGSQLSLAAFRTLGLGLTDLPQVTVYGR